MSTKGPPPQRRGIYVAALALLLAGCASYPLGMTEAEWTALTPQQQAEYRAQQAAIDAREAAQATQLRIARENAAAEALRIEGERVSAVYASARRGDIVTVRVTGGMVAFSGKRFAYEPVAFDIARGETKSVAFSRLGQPGTTTSIIMSLSEDGNTFLFDAPAPKRFVALRDTSWELGARYSVPAIGSGEGRSEAIDIRLVIQIRDLSRGDQRRPAAR